MYLCGVFVVDVLGGVGQMQIVWKWSYITHN